LLKCKEKKNPTTYTNLYTIFQSNERENSKLKQVRRTKREREREREREVVAARRRSGALLLSMMSLFGFEKPKMSKLAFKRECPQRDNPLPTN
jgi:hypothetical protein